MSKYW